MKVTSIIKTRPDTGEEQNQPREVQVRSHWNYNDRVHLVMELNGKEQVLTLLSADLTRAVSNATNHK